MSNFHALIQILDILIKENKDFFGNTGNFKYDLFKLLQSRILEIHSYNKNLYAFNELQSTLICNLIIFISSINRRGDWNRSNITNTTKLLIKTINKSPINKQLFKNHLNSKSEVDCKSLDSGTSLLDKSNFSHFKSPKQIVEYFREYINGLDRHLFNKNHDALKKQETIIGYFRDIKNRLNNKEQKRQIIQREFDWYISKVQVSNTGVSMNYDKMTPERKQVYMKTPEKVANQKVTELRKNQFLSKEQWRTITTRTNIGNCGDQARSMAEILNRHKGGGVAYPVGLVGVDHALVLYDFEGNPQRDPGHIFDFEPARYLMVDPWAGYLADFSIEDTKFSKIQRIDSKDNQQIIWVIPGEKNKYLEAEREDDSEEEEEYHDKFGSFI
ncbi:hypothetical protein [Francisella sp. W12-1067]